MKNKKLSRRKILGGAVGVTALASGRGLLGAPALSTDGPALEAHDARVMSTTGEVDLSQFDPSKFLYEFDYGQVSELPDGQTLREWDIVAVDKEIEIAPGVYFPAWTYNGQVPGPTLRCTEGIAYGSDSQTPAVTRIRSTFTVFTRPTWMAFLRW